MNLKNKVALCLVFLNALALSANAQITKSELKEIYERVIFNERDVNDTSLIYIENQLIPYFIGKNELCTFKRISDYVDIDSLTFQKLRNKYSQRGKEWIFKLFDSHYVRIVTSKETRLLVNEADQTSYHNNQGEIIYENKKTPKKKIWKFSAPAIYGENCFIYCHYRIGLGGGKVLFILKKENGHWALVKEMGCAIS